MLADQRTPVSGMVSRMTAQDEFKRVLRDVVSPSARSAGFKGSGRTWRSTNALGDVAIANVQSLSSSSSERVRCVLNLAVAPAPWLDWMRELLPNAFPKAIGESLGLYRERLQSPRHGWEITGASSADSVASDMVTQLDQYGWPVLRRLLDRRAFVDALRAGRIGTMTADHNPVFFASAEAVLIADDGPSTRLDELLDYEARYTIEPQRYSAAMFAEWARERADRVARSRS
jgi:hypothetical protein